jgi:hypothetical protein
MAVLHVKAPLITKFLRESEMALVNAEIPI